MGTDCFLPALLLLLLLLLLRRADATFMLPAPKNVRIDSYNLQHKLLWDPILLEGVRYTVQFKWNSEHEEEYIPLCMNRIEPVCDFTEEIPFEWLIVLRVRAEHGPVHSNWTDTSEFQAATHTKLGPVNFLTVSTRAAEHSSLYVSFESPLPPSTTPAEYRMKYLLQYWRSGSAVKTELWIKNTFNKLTNLEASTEYCVNVTAVMEIPPVMPDLIGETSHVVCAKTPGAPGLTADKLIFIFMGLIIFCCLFTGFSYAFSRHYRLIKMWLYPPYNIPPDIQQYLQDPPWNGYLEESKEMHLAGEPYDHISIVESES